MLPVIIIIVINAAGFLLKYNELDRFFVFLGFRFHLSLLLPLFILLNNDLLNRAKDMLLKPAGRKYLLTASFILLPALITAGALYLSGKAELNDPDYLYELGFSSIIDFPLYLIWNMPQLIATGLFLLLITDRMKFRFPVIFITMLLLFAYEFIPSGGEKLALKSLYGYAAVVLVLSLFLSGVRNVYLFAAAAFGLMWSHVLLFGSGSAELIQLLLARTYDTWEGFFGIAKGLKPWGLLIQTGTALILFAVPLLICSFRKDKNETGKSEVKQPGREDLVSSNDI